MTKTIDTFDVWILKVEKKYISCKGLIEPEHDHIMIRTSDADFCHIYQKLCNTMHDFFYVYVCIQDTRISSMKSSIHIKSYFSLSKSYKSLGRVNYIFLRFLVMGEEMSRKTE